MGQGNAVADVRLKRRGFGSKLPRHLASRDYMGEAPSALLSFAITIPKDALAAAHACAGA